MTSFFWKCNTSPGQGQHRMGRTTKVKPQATLTFMSGRPPILDPRPAKPQPADNAPPTSWPGQMFSHLTSYFSFQPAVHWVNPQVVRDCPALSQYPVMPCPAEDTGGGLWHPAPSGGLIQQQMMMMDPMQMLKSNTATTKSYLPNYFSSGYPIPNKLTSKPLNPNAKEWVPKAYRMPPPATTTPDAGYIVKAPHPHLHAPTSHIPADDFCEITEEEVKEVCGQPCGTPWGSASSSSTEGIKQCCVSVPQQCGKGKEVTANMTNTNSGSSCLESTLVPEKKVEMESPMQSSLFQSPPCTTTPATMCDGMECVCVCQGCASPVCGKMERTSVGQARDSQKSCSLLNRKSPTPLTEKPSPTTATTSSSSIHAGPDQVQQSVVCATNGLSPELNQSKAGSVLLNSQNINSSSANCIQTANSSLESLQSSLVSHGKSHSPIQESIKVGSSLEVSQSQGNATGNSTSLSYAGVVGRASPSPSPPPHESPEQHKYKGVEQPLPKIFQRDRTPPREEEVPYRQDKLTPKLFKRPSKTQRTRSRKFLQDLKEESTQCSGGGGGGDILSCSLSSSSSSSSSVSPSGLPSPSSSPCTLSVLSSSPSCGSPKALSSAQPIPIPTASRGMSESPGNHTRSSSESSTASLDIEFVGHDDVDCQFVDPVTTPSKSKGNLGMRNGFLACILGSGDTDSETEDESDSDWDEVCEEDTKNSTLGLMDPWETFNIGLVVVECQLSPHTQDQNIPKEEPSDSTINDVNKRWNREVAKDVRGKSVPRVSFGGEEVHRMVVWSHAYREARRGPWEQQARDRARFAQRVACLEPTLSLVLDRSHRRAVYRRLYAPPPPRCFL